MLNVDPVRTKYPFSELKSRGDCFGGGQAFVRHILASLPFDEQAQTLNIIVRTVSQEYLLNWKPP